MRTLKTSRRCRRPSVERLDDRCLLAGGLQASLVGGVLTIVGTPGADQVTVNVTPGGGVSARRAFARAAAVGATAPRSGSRTQSIEAPASASQSDSPRIAVRQSQASAARAP